MFKIALSATYAVAVNVETPNEKGTFDKSKFTATFKRSDIDQLDELRKLSQRDVLKDVLVGWSGLVDEHDENVPFSPGTRDAVLQIPQALFALAEAFWGSIHKAKEKN
ncbi:MAG TPA: hypothetical protein VF774_12665 [Pseudoduganella sp.]|jgi:hypothetical protein